MTGFGDTTGPLCDNYHGSQSPTVLAPSSRSTGIIPSPRQEGIAMTDQNSEDRELSIEELTMNELDSVSGGRFKIPTSDAVKAWKIAKIERDNPGF